MKRSKKIFIALALLFFLLLLYIAYDFSSRTTFPGSGPPAAPEPTQAQSDSIREDTLR